MTEGECGKGFGLILLNGKSVDIFILVGIINYYKEDRERILH